MAHIQIFHLFSVPVALAAHRLEYILHVYTIIFLSHTEYIYRLESIGRALNSIWSYQSIRSVETDI